MEKVFGPGGPVSGREKVLGAWQRESFFLVDEGGVVLSSLSSLLLSFLWKGDADDVFSGCRGNGV